LDSFGERHPATGVAGARGWPDYAGLLCFRANLFVKKWLKIWF
jgi:hypothetical protein